MAAVGAQAGTINPWQALGDGKPSGGARGRGGRTRGRGTGTGTGTGGSSNASLTGLAVNGSGAFSPLVGSCNADGPNSCSCVLRILTPYPTNSMRAPELLVHSVPFPACLIVRIVSPPQMRSRRSRQQRERPQVQRALSLSLPPPQASPPLPCLEQRLTTPLSARKFSRIAGDQECSRRHVRGSTIGRRCCCCTGQGR